MLFDFTSSQYDMASAVDTLLDRAVPPTRLRQAWADPDSVATHGWEDLAEFGLFSILALEDDEGGGPDDLTLLLELVGYHCVPGPVVESAAVAIDVLVRYGDAQTQGMWLDCLAEGTFKATVIIDGAPAAGAQDADVAIVIDDDAAYLLPLEGVERTAYSTQDPTRRVAQVDIASISTRGIPLGTEAAARARAMAEFGTAAVLTGINRRLIEMTQEYVLERKQFGKVIGEFQAVKHQLADALVANEAAKVLVSAASYALREDTQTSRLMASMAKSSASSASSVVNAAALQLHGGIGFTWEHDLHLWMKRGKALEQAYGNHHRHRRAVGTALFSGERIVE